MKGHWLGYLIAFALGVMFAGKVPFIPKVG